VCFSFESDFLAAHFGLGLENQSLNAPKPKASTKTIRVETDRSARNLVRLRGSDSGGLREKIIKDLQTRNGVVREEII
jgi:hypothetical protein